MQNCTQSREALQQIGRIKVTASVTDASCGGTSAIDKSLVDQRFSVPEHCIISKNLVLGFNERNKKIQDGISHNKAKEADSNSNVETNNTIHCASPLHRSGIFVPISGDCKIKRCCCH
ncbi:hypothetical protein O6H91_04G035500 [Diphasiastrum complanatum]|uniref:Uncharacterized protein n=1 Tax=Diphasiastrum complanatum TaxID=34168 RepID=A0ACC2DVT7_DIPCM|nr:hypothetical protein O6H91_04G035500 [Diphasiastrum complanatum]